MWFMLSSFTAQLMVGILKKLFTEQFAYVVLVHGLRYYASKTKNALTHDLVTDVANALDVAGNPLCQPPKQEP